MSNEDFKAWAEQAGEDMRANLEHWGNDPEAGDEIANHRSSRFHPPDDEPDDDDEDEERTDFSADQERDDHGRFAGAGVMGHEGGKTGPSASTGPLGRQGYSGVHPREWVGHQNPDKSWTGHIAGKSDETWKDHFSAHPDKGGRPLDERREIVHDPIIKAAFEGKIPAAKIGNGEKKTAILTMGGPGSGKGVVLDKLAKHGLDLKHFVHVDPDAVKEKLPEYKQSVAREGDFDRTFRGAANQVHEESSYLAKQIAAKAIEGGHHVVIDGTGGNADKFIGAIKKLEGAGYDVHVHHPILSTEEGNARVQARAETSGRLVQPDFVKETYAKISDARSRIYAVAPNLTIYDASNRVPGDFKSSHVPVYEKHFNQEPVVHDPEFVRTHVQEGGAGGRTGTSEEGGREIGFGFGPVKRHDGEEVRTDYSPDQPRDDKGRFAGGGDSGGGSAKGGGSSEAGSAGGSPNGPTKGGADHAKAIHGHFQAANKSMSDANSAKTAKEKAEHLAKAADSYGKAAEIAGTHGEHLEANKGGARAAAADANTKASAAHKQAAKEATDPKEKAAHTAAAKEYAGRAKAQREGAKDDHPPGEKPKELPKDGQAHENGPKNAHEGGEPLKQHNGEHGTEKAASGHIASFIDFLNKPLEGKEGDGGSGGGGEGHGKAIKESTSSSASAKELGAKSGHVHHDSEEIRTDDWNEELHPRVPAGGPGGGQFGSGGGGGGPSITNEAASGGGGGGGSGLKSSSGGASSAGSATTNPNALVSLHRVIGAKPNVEKVLKDMPKEKLYTKDEPPPDPKRATERAALAKALVIPVADGPKVPLDLAKHQKEAEEVRQRIAPEHHDGLVKMSDGYDYTMKQLETGASPAKLAAGVEAHWNSQLTAKGIDVVKLSPADRAAIYKQHFKDESGAAHVATAHEALKHVQDMFAKTPPTPGVVYRGMKNVTPEVMEKILNSKTMSLDSMSSFSFDHGVAHDYATGAQASKAAADVGARAAVFGADKVMPNGVQVLMRVSHKSGVNMMASSVYQKEREVLLPKSAKFRITGVSRSAFTPQNLTNGDPPHIVVDMEEI